MKFGYRLTLIFFLLFIIGIFTWALFSPKQDISEKIHKTIKAQEKIADLAFKDVTFEEVVNGKKYWQLQAKKALVNKSTNLATLKDSEGTFFKNGKPTLLFSSPASLWDMKKKEILLDQPIGYDPSLKNDITKLSQRPNNQSIFNLPQLYGKSSGFWFKANNLSWKVDDQKLLCIGNIRLNKGEVTGYCGKLEGDVGFEKVLLEEKPTVVIQQKNNTPTTLEAKIFEIRSKENLILAYGSPQIIWKEAVILAQFIKYNQKERVLNLNGRAKITYKDIVAWGNSANYYIDDDIIEIIGNAQAKQGENRLKGKKIRVDLKDQKISVVGKGKIVISEEGILEQ